MAATATLSQKRRCRLEGGESESREVPDDHHVTQPHLRPATRRGPSSRAKRDHLGRGGLSSPPRPTAPVAAPTDGPQLPTPRSSHRRRCRLRRHAGSHGGQRLGTTAKRHHLSEIPPTGFSGDRPTWPARAPAMRHRRGDEGDPTPVPPRSSEFPVPARSRDPPPRSSRGGTTMSGVVVLIVLAALAALTSAPKISTWAASRRRREAPPIAEPSTWVRVLRGGEELEEALERARRYDETAEAALRRRIERYRAAAPTNRGAVVALRAHSGDEAGLDDHKTA